MLDLGEGRPRKGRKVPRRVSSNVGICGQEQGDVWDPGSGAISLTSTSLVAGGASSLPCRFRIEFSDHRGDRPRAPGSVGRANELPRPRLCICVALMLSCRRKRKLFCWEPYFHLLGPSQQVDFVSFWYSSFFLRREE